MESDSDYMSLDSDTDTSDDSITSSIFGFTCNLCGDRASGATDLEFQYLGDSVILVDNELILWLKCDNCGACYHKNCWQKTAQGVVDDRFKCCEYTGVISI